MVSQRVRPDWVTNTTHKICHEVVGLDAMILVFWMLSFKPAYSLSFFTFIKRLLSPSLLYDIKMVSSAYLRLLIFSPAILIPAAESSSSAFHMMHSVYNLNKQSDKYTAWTYSFPNFEPVCYSMSSSNYCFLSCIQVSQEVGIPISLRLFHNLLWSTQSKALA